MCGHIIYSVFDLLRDIIVSLYFVEKISHRIVVDDHQTCESTSMWHTENSIVNTIIRLIFTDQASLSKYGVQSDSDRFRTLRGITLMCGESLLHNLLHLFCSYQ